MLRNRNFKFYLRTISVFNLTVSLVLLLIYTSAAPAQIAAHRHPEQQEIEIPEIEIVETKPGKNARREKFVHNREFEGFSVYEEGIGYRIFFVERRSRRTYEIRGVGLPWRQFSDLVWKNGRTFVFDCWGNPSHGTHYEFDAREKRLKKVLIFRDLADASEQGRN
jgi:hypothetical protein